MQCQKCGRVVRPGNTTGRNESLTERRYYCSCGFVNKTVEQVIVTWKKMEYKPRTVPTVEPVAEVPVEKPKHRRRNKTVSQNITPT